LHTTVVGHGPIRYVFCHGLFGRGRNWTSQAKCLLPAASLLVDLPNHGKSIWTNRFSYTAIAHSLGEVLGAVEPPAEESRDLTLVGHSMGGRVAMLTALGYPEVVRRLVVVDVAPTGTPVPSVGDHIQALQALGPAELSQRRTAEQALATTITDPRVRSFLMTGYQPTPEGGRWHYNLEVLAHDLDKIMDWPDPGPIEPYHGPVLWLAGSESEYIKPDSYTAMAALFPDYRLETIAGAGHWVHADAPEAFLEALTRFVAETPLH